MGRPVVATGRQPSGARCRPRQARGPRPGGQATARAAGQHRGARCRAAAADEAPAGPAPGASRDAAAGQATGLAGGRGPVRAAPADAGRGAAARVVNSANRSRLPRAHRRGAAACARASAPAGARRCAVRRARCSRDVYPRDATTPTSRVRDLRAAYTPTATRSAAVAGGISQPQRSRSVAAAGGRGQPQRSPPTGVDVLPM